ncbi:hypothetical protein NMY22_g18253 [Coprinellus aureogranulatus]|nr:hypothetical protein NMY22_g18253 [Coprinellus aureogranulatus]
MDTVEHRYALALFLLTTNLPYTRTTLSESLSAEDELGERLSQLQLKDPVDLDKHGLADKGGRAGTGLRVPDIEERLSFGAVGRFPDNTRPRLGPVEVAKRTLPEGHVHIAGLSALNSESVLIEGHADELKVARRHGEGDDQARSVGVHMRRDPVVVEDPPTHDLKIGRSRHLGGQQRPTVVSC